MTSQLRTYTCPMHPEVRQPRPGSCPKCGMALEPVAAEAPMTRTEYVCPMHPQIVRNAPGSCPICGMALEPRTVTGDEENAELKDRKSTRLNSSHDQISYAVFCLKKKKQNL